MLQRHRIPTVFSIYMLDVICCALGCVILLWQVAHQDLRDRTAEARESQTKADEQSVAANLARTSYENAKNLLFSAESNVSELQNDVTQLRALIAMLKNQKLELGASLAQAEKDRDAAQRLALNRREDLDKSKKLLALSDEQLAKLKEDLAKLLASNKKIEAELTGKIEVNLELLAKIALTDKQLDSVRRELDTTKTQILTTMKKMDGQVALLKVSEEEAAKLKEILERLRLDNKDAMNKLKAKDLENLLVRADLEKLRTEMSKNDKKSILTISEADQKIAELLRERAKDGKQIAASAEQIQALLTQLDTQKKKYFDLRTEADNRFAGVPLTGESVIFLIDVSGSMTMKDSKTADPDKWPSLCETLMRLMRSIPGMRRFQVILFSEKTHFLFGHRDYWLTYRGPEDAVSTSNALKKFKVEGGTNMYEGFEEAFRYRNMKDPLDTIYLFSDGLPNIGEGLPSSIKEPTEEQRNHYLGKYVRDKLNKDWNRPIDGKSVRINAIGFYFESPDVGAFLWALTREHRGSFVGLR